MRRRASGSVTVLFSFIMFLLISLVLVSVESARQQASASILQTNLSVAMTSLGGRYYAPLYDEYDIYGLLEKSLTEDILSCLRGSMDPLCDLPDGYTGNTESGYSFACRDITVRVEKQYCLTDAEGAFLRRQMIEAGAVGGAEALLTELLQAVGVLKEEEPGFRLMEKQAKAEEKLTAMDALLLELMPVLDGVPTNLSGILCDEDGAIHPERYFAKCLTLTEPTSESVGMDSFGLFYCLYPYYTNITEWFETEREERAAFEASKNEEDETEWNFETIDLMEFHLERVVKKNREAATKLGRLRVLQEEVIPLLAEYENDLSEYGSVLGDGWKDALTESLAVMKRYAGKTGDFYDFRVMKERVEKNLRCLTNLQQALTTYREADSEHCEEALSAAEQCLDGYSIEGLSLRYQGMRKGTTVKDSFLRTLKNLLTDGLTYGIIDSSDLSAKRLMGLRLPSETIGAGTFDVFDIELPEAASDIGGGTLFAVIRGMNLDRLRNIFEEGTESLTEKALLVSYAGTHFSDYSDPDKDGVLSYQTEYLLYGKKNDPDNLKRAALGVLGIRFLFNLAHTLTNPEKRERALYEATEIFGAAIPFLTKACQYVILIAWALQNAKLETVELLKGKKVPILVTGASFQTSYEEIASIDRETRFQKAEAYEDADGAAPKYGIYLLMFLMLHGETDTVFRSMDMIQENIRIGYEPSFLISDCLCAVSVRVQAVLPGRYTSAGGSRTVEAFGIFRY